MCVLGWVVQSGGTEFKQYEAAIKALPMPK
jgi:hypothetical protein